MGGGRGGREGGSGRPRSTSMSQRKGGREGEAEGERSADTGREGGRKTEEVTIGGKERIVGRVTTETTGTRSEVRALTVQGSGLTDGDAAVRATQVDVALGDGRHAQLVVRPREEGGEGGGEHHAAVAGGAAHGNADLETGRGGV